MMAFSVLLALTPIIPLFRPDIQGIIVIEFGAVGLLRLCTLARTDDLPAVRRSAGGSMIIDGTVIDARATVVDGSAPPPPSGPGPGRAASDAAGSGSPANPTKAGRTSDAAARWVGQASGVVITSGKQVAAAHRPEVEAQVKRGIRSLGKLAGKLTKPTPPDGSAD